MEPWVEFAVKRICRSVGTSFSQRVSAAIDGADHNALLALKVNPRDYESHITFSDDYLLQEYLSKYQGLDTGIDTKAAALIGFLQSEDNNRQTNKRLYAYWSGTETPPAFIQRVLSLAQSKIQNCVGDQVPWRRIIQCVGWGKGATFSLKASAATLDAKITEENISITQQALPLLRAAMATDYQWLAARGLRCDGPTSLVNSEFAVVHGCRATVVPKNAKTDRFIAIEPSGNIVLQKGIGNEIRKCLRRVGINLNDQSINQGLASIALRDGLATVDLKNASNSVTSAIVWQLLPPAWSSLLDRCRSHNLLLDDKWIPLEMFSSMGNGFTFELESLLFWALTESVRDALGETGRVSVFGDDIICPDVIVPELIRVLDYCGFSVNTEKTHYGDSPFRESCGSHFFKGYNVTPIYQKEVVSDWSDFHRFYNRLVYYAIRRGSHFGNVAFADKRFRWVKELTRFTTSEYRIPIDPDNPVLDGGLAVSVESLPTEKSRVPAWVFKPTKRKLVCDLPMLTVRFRNSTTHDDPSSVRGYLRILRKGYHQIHRDGIAAWDIDNEPPFDGSINDRGVGKWTRKKVHMPARVKLHWI